MKDPRIAKMAEVLVNYSTKIKNGDRVYLSGSDLAKPVLTELFRSALKRGAYPQVHMECDGISEIMLKEGSDEQIVYENPMARYVVENYDVLIHVHGGYNLKALSNILPQKKRLAAQGRKEIVRIHLERAAKKELRWCICQFPTHSSAQEAGMSLDEYEDFVYKACFLDKDDPIAAWSKLHDDQEGVCRYLEGKKSLRIISKDTEISCFIEGRKWINGSGKENFPCGEVFSAPHERSLEGEIRFSYPGIYWGQEIENIRLKVEHGKITEARADRGEELLNTLLDTDQGSRYFGEIGIGTNFGIEKFTKNMLFDEKIGGTIHLAVGAAYPECGGENVSSIHWDMLCDMKDKGKIFADGELIYEKGKFLVD